MKTLKTLSYQDLLTEQVLYLEEDGISKRIAQHPVWGSWEHKSIEMPHFSMNAYQANLTSPMQLHFEDPKMSSRMNICAAIEGQTTAYSKLYALSLPLDSRRYHHVFLNDDCFEFQVNPYFTNIHIQIDIAYYQELLCESNQWMSTLKNSLGKGSNVLTENAFLSAAMIEIIRDLLQNPLTGQFKKLYAEAKLLELTALQLAQLSTTDQSQNKPVRDKDKDIFHAVREYLALHFAEDLSLQQLSRNFGINEFKLKKGFKEIFHSTVFDYIFEKRMEQAYSLLTEQHLLVHEVSSRVGYKNSNHFATAFKKRFGKSPSAL